MKTALLRQRHSQTQVHPDNDRKTGAKSRCGGERGQRDDASNSGDHETTQSEKGVGVLDSGWLCLPWVTPAVKEEDKDGVLMSHLERGNRHTFCALAINTGW